MKKAEIEKSLCETAAYLCILSESGAGTADAAASLAEHAAYFGAAAEELKTAADETRLGVPIFNALENTAKTTPSEKLAAFLLGYVSSVKTTGTAVPYLRGAADTFLAKRKTAQKQYLDSLTIFAEIYLTLFAAAPLFFTVAWSAMLMISDTARPELINTLCIALPLLTAVFLIGIDRMEYLPKTAKKPPAEPEIAIPAWLKRHDRRMRQIAALKNPIRYLTENPKAVLIGSIPAALLLSIPVRENPYLCTAVLVLVSGVPYAVFSLRQEKRQREIEQALPEYLRSLGRAVNQGISLSEAVLLTVPEKSGIKEDIQQIADEIRFQTPVQTAFFHFASRVKNPAVTRMVILLGECCRFESNVSNALFRMADEQQEAAEAAEARRTGMAPYTAVIYLAYLVFLFVMVILLLIFPGDIAEYSTYLVNTVVIQGICSGFAAGKMGGGKTSAGVMHACVMFAAGVVTFAVCGII